MLQEPCIAKMIKMAEAHTVYTLFKNQMLQDQRQLMIMLIIRVKYGLVLQKDGE